MNEKRENVRSLTADEIDLVVGGVMQFPDGRSCTEGATRWPFGVFSPFGPRGTGGARPMVVVGF